MRKIKESWHHKSATIIEFDRAMNLPTPCFPARWRGRRAAPAPADPAAQAGHPGGQLPAGGKLPSSRTLADELDISRNTVLIAYEQLTAEAMWSPTARARAWRLSPPRPAPPARPNRRNRRPSPPRGWAASPPPACNAGADAGHAGAEPVPRQRLAPRAGPRAAGRAVRHAGLRPSDGRAGAARRHRQYLRVSRGCAAMPRMWSSPRAPRARWRCACSC